MNNLRSISSFRDGTTTARLFQFKAGRAAAGLVSGCQNEVKRRVSLASSVGIGDWGGGLVAVADDSAVANGAGEPCRAGANAPGLSR